MDFCKVSGLPGTFPSFPQKIKPQRNGWGWGGGEGRGEQKAAVWWFEMSKMLTNFTFNLPFCCKVSHSGITSSAFSLPLSEKHIGAELASCLPPSPSATIILRYHPTFWPSSLWGGGERKRREGGRGTQLLLQHIHGGEARMNQTNTPIGHGIDGELRFLQAEFTPASIHPHTVRALHCSFTVTALQLH